MRSITAFLFAAISILAGVGCGPGARFTAPSIVEAGQSIPVQVTVRKKPEEASSGRLWYRAQGQPSFTMIDLLSSANGAILSAQIPSEATRDSGAAVCASAIAPCARSGERYRTRSATRSEASASATSNATKVPWRAGSAMPAAQTPLSSASKE